MKDAKELAQLNADRLSCHRFWANQFRLLLQAAAYVLRQGMRSALAGTEFARDRGESAGQLSPHSPESISSHFFTIPYE